MCRLLDHLSPDRLWPSAALLAVLLMTPGTSLAQGTTRDPGITGFYVDVNVLGTANSLARERQFESRFLQFGEVGTFRATYAKPARTTMLPLIDVGGGVMLRRLFAIGISYSRTTHDDVVGLGATIPHPTVFNAAASDSGVSGETLRRRDAAIHFSLSIVPIRSRRTLIRIAGGPSFVTYRADMVHEVLYHQSYDPVAQPNSITIDGLTSREANGSGVGFHVGGDVMFFFSKAVGIGGGVRFTRATATIGEEPLSTLRQDIRVGGTLVLLGVRVRVDR